MALGDAVVVGLLDLAAEDVVATAGADEGNCGLGGGVGEVTFLEFGDEETSGRVAKGLVPSRYFSCRSSGMRLVTSGFIVTVTSCGVILTGTGVGSGAASAGFGALTVAQPARRRMERQAGMKCFDEELGRWAGRFGVE